LHSYRANFNPSGIEGELARLEAEHTALVDKWSDLPTPRAKEKAKERFEALEARMEALRQQQQDASDVVTRHWQELRGLQRDVRGARAAMLSEGGERALKQKAAALRAVIHRVECTFRATGKVGGGWGKRNSELVRVTVLPVVGEKATYAAKSALQPSREWALEYVEVPFESLEPSVGSPTAG
jgi:hypothetical protein